MSDVPDKHVETGEIHDDKISTAVKETLQTTDSVPLDKYDEAITLPLPPSVVEPVNLDDLGFIAADDAGLGDVIDDFDKAVSLKADENKEQSPYEELQRIQSVQSHLSAGKFHNHCKRIP